MRGKKNTNPKIDAIRAATRSEPAAVQFMEARLWGDNPACVRCGSVSVYQMKDSKTGGRNKDFRWRCRDCKRMYTVRTGTVMESSRLPLTAWVHAFWRSCASKKGVSALQISRELDINYKTALFLLNRIRFAMKDWPGDGSQPKMGAGGGTVEADETYVGGKPRYKGVSKRGRGTKKTPVFAMVERGGRLRMQVVERVTAKDLGKIVDENLNITARLMTDDLGVYKPIGRKHPGVHESVKHGKGEYVRKGNPEIHSNTIESAFSLLKRGVYGTYHSISKRHLPRYLGEFEFRWNTRFDDDGERTFQAVKKSEGKRLIYRSTGT